jgi:hypothetical protein
MRRLGFLGTSRIDAARKLLPGLVADWRGQWCFVDEQAQGAAKCSDETALSLREGEVPPLWQKAQGRVGAIWLAGQHADTWQKMLFGPYAKEVPDDAVARHLLAQAQLALVNALLAGLQQAPVDALPAESPSAPGALFDDRLVLSIPVQGTLLYVLIDATLLERFLPPLPAKPALVNRQTAIGKATIKLQVRLPLASLAVGEMNNLQPGDILRARTELAQPLSLVSEQNEMLAEGYLARHQDHLVLQLSN